ALTPGAAIVFNADDAALCALLDRQLAAQTGSPMRYGLHAAADIAGAVLQRTSGGTLLEIRGPGGAARVELRAPGLGVVYAALAGVAAATAAGEHFETAVA